MNLTEHITRFFSKLPFRKILLGLSGGPDSMALFHLLLSQKDLQIGIAHVDHGWRQESKGEAAYLENLVAEWNLPFYLHKMPAVQGNLENESRKQRMGFFQKICQEHGYEAVVLAHHADDQAETVLKRCLEGASILSLEGMEECKMWSGIPFLRPLLHIAKKDLVDYLDQSKIAYFIDKTNLDEKFLRGRMRKEIFPFLNESFGKNIRGPLCNLATSSQELREYVEGRIEEANIGITRSDLGVYADLIPLKHEVEVKWFLSRFFKEQGIVLSREQLIMGAECILEKKANRQMPLQKMTVFFDRGFFFTVEKKEFCSIPWKLKFEKFKRGDTEMLGWKTVFAGQCRAILPFGSYTLGTPGRESMPSLDRLWNKNRVPAFLRNQVPILCDERGNVALEFLSGEKLLKDTPSGGEVTVSLYRE